MRNNYLFLKILGPAARGMGAAKPRTYNANGTGNRKKAVYHCCATNLMENRGCLTEGLGLLSGVSNASQPNFWVGCWGRTLTGMGSYHQIGPRCEQQNPERWDLSLREHMLSFPPNSPCSLIYIYIYISEDRSWNTYPWGRLIEKRLRREKSPNETMGLVN